MSDDARETTPPSPGDRPPRRRTLAILVRIGLGLVLFTALGALILLLRRPDLDTFARLEDRTTEPRVEAPGIEITADLAYPPGDIAVSDDGRVFLTFHPVGRPTTTLVEMIGPEPHPYPADPVSGEPLLELDSPLAIHIDDRNRLWVLEQGHLTFHRPRLMRFDLNTNELTDSWDLPRDLAGFGSMLTDFQVDPGGETVYISDASPLFQKPALIVYDLHSKKGRRVLEGHPSIQAEKVLIQAPPDGLSFLGFPVQIGVSALALDPEGKWLYFAATSSSHLYRIATEDLKDGSLSAQELGDRVKLFSEKPVTGGITADAVGDVYLTDVENAAVLRIGRDRKAETLLKSRLLRWPAGLSFGPDGWLWVACSSVHEFLFDATARHRPYFLIRFRPPPPSD